PRTPPGDSPGPRGRSRETARLEPLRPRPTGRLRGRTPAPRGRSRSQLLRRGSRAQVHALTLEQRLVQPEYRLPHPGFLDDEGEVDAGGALRNERHIDVRDGREHAR